MAIHYIGCQNEFGTPNTDLDAMKEKSEKIWRDFLLLRIYLARCADLYRIEDEI